MYIKIGRRIFNFANSQTPHVTSPVTQACAEDLEPCGSYAASSHFDLSKAVGKATVCLIILFYSSDLVGQSASVLSLSQPYRAEKVAGALKKGSRLAMIDIAGGLTNGARRKNAFWSIAPSAAYLVTDGLSAGLRVSYGLNSSTRKDPAYSIPNHTYHSLAPEIFARYYVTPYRIRPFVQIAAGYNAQWGYEENALRQKQEVRSSNIIGSAAGGITFLLSRKLTLDLMYNQRLFAESKFWDANERTKVRIGFSWSMF